MIPLSRREAVVSSFAFVGTALATGCVRAAQSESPKVAPAPAPTPANPPGSATTSMALAGNHQPVALGYPASSLNGLSERLIKSHHENNYAGAVKNLNRVEQELMRVSPDTPAFLVAALRQRELMFKNSKLLHEAYFANLGGDGRRSGGIETALTQAYGSSARWEEHFRMSGLGLGGGSGWVVLAFELDTGGLRTFASGDHTQALAMALPLFVMDMYEHSYQMDFGSAHARYIDAFFANANWDEVNRRYEQAQRALKALH